MGKTYTVAAQTPQYSIDSINAPQNTPIPMHTLSKRAGNMTTLTPEVLPVVINHHNGAPVFDIYANTQDSDLGSGAAKINRIVKDTGTLPVRCPNPSSTVAAFRSNYRLSKAQEQEMLLEYQKTILNTLNDVSSSLVINKEIREGREEQTALVVSATDAVWLAKMRYAAGTQVIWKSSPPIQICTMPN